MILHTPVQFSGLTMDRVHSAKMKEMSKSPRSPMNSEKSFKSENREVNNGGAKDCPKKKGYVSTSMKFDKPPKIQSPLTKSSSLSSNKSSPRLSQLQASKSSSPRSEEISANGDNNKFVKRTNLRVSLSKKQDNVSNDGAEDSPGGQNSEDLGHFLLNQARHLIADSPPRALQFALRAAKSFEKGRNGNPNLGLVMCLHVTAAILCRLEQYDDAIPVLERAAEIPVLERGHDHALAKFSGYMQLGDTYAMLGQLENSIHCYTLGLEVQKHALGENDSRVGDTCRYLAEAHMQALQFDEAESLCLAALKIHMKQRGVATLEETADRRLLGLICETKGDHEAALEHLIFASIGMSSSSNCQEAELASVNCSIGDSYLSLARYDEAIFSYQKALTVFKSTKGENHATVASVIVRLANLYNKIGKFRESKSYCESALRVYEKPHPGTAPEEIASGYTEISAIYESMEESEQAIKLLKKAQNIYTNSPGQQSAVAGIEAQLGVLYYITENYVESYSSFKIALDKLRVCGEKKPAYLGIVLNQMGLACLQLNAIDEAADLFEEARDILEQDCGPYHPDTLGVCSNLAGTYDAIGR